MPGRLGTRHHVVLTVTDLDRSSEWYCRLLGLTVVSTHVNVGPPYLHDNKYNGLFDLSTMSYVVGLTQHADPLVSTFDERVIGLDHFGIEVPDLTELHAWVRHLDELGIKHSGIVNAPYIDVVNFRDPDNIAIELCVLNNDFWVPLVTAKLADAAAVSLE
jgi:catechol 2,3-dioxygenase-like lactoylglutathione lyase family enzyme